MAYNNHDPGPVSSPFEPGEINEILESAGRHSEEANSRLIKLFENFLQLARRQTWLDPQQDAGLREMWALLKRSSWQSYETQRRLHELMDDYQRFMAREIRSRTADTPPPPAPAPARMATPPPPPPAPAPPPVRASVPPPPPPESVRTPAAPPAPAPVAAVNLEESSPNLSERSVSAPTYTTTAGSVNSSPRDFLIDELKAAGNAGLPMRSLNQKFMNRFALRSSNPGSLWATNISRLTKSGEIRAEEKVDGRWYRISIDGKG